MNKRNVLLFLACVASCGSREPFKPREGSVPFLVYYASRYRGLCVGTLVSHAVVLSAAVCVTSHEAEVRDTRPITVITGTKYRHVRRGIRVPVWKILFPRFTNLTGNRAFAMQKSPAALLLKHGVPDALTEVPLRAIGVSWQGDETLTLHEECFMPGWHFFYKNDPIYPVHKFLLQRTVRVQFLNVVKRSEWCEALTIKFQKALISIGLYGTFNTVGYICVKDPDRSAQPCHGMYGAPLICRGMMMGMLMAPDAQWTNCTGMSNLVNLLSGVFIRNFMTCVSRIFQPDRMPTWSAMKKELSSDPDHDVYDYVPALYDHMRIGSSSSSSSTEEN